MVLVSRFSYFLTGIPLIQHSYCFDPSNVQVDIIFPKNNSVYLPIYPFPVIFALHNFSAVWQYEPILKWRLKSWINHSSYGQWGLASGDILTEWNREWAPPPDKHIMINSTASEAVVYNNESIFAIEWFFGLGDGERCRPAPKQPPYADYTRGLILFNTSNVTGVMPDITSGGPCALPLGAIGYLGANQTDATCPLLSRPRPTPALCAYLIDAQLEDQVSKTMVNESRCGDKFKWPTRAQTCPKSEGSIVKEWSSFVMLPSIAVLLLSLI